jgi:hypothetical protein
MRWPVYLYYLFMIVCFIDSLFYFKYFKIRLLAILLFFSILVEVLSEWIGVAGSDHFFLYHFYNILEYVWVTWILFACINNSKNYLRIFLIISMILYACLSLWISYEIEDLHKFPSISTNIESVGVIIWCLIGFWKIEPINDIPIQRRSDFWIILAFFVYFSGTFCFNSIYNYLLNNGKQTAESLFSIINSFFNYLLYIFLIIGLQCFRTERKYSEQ